MALNHITFYSKLMEMEMGIDVIIPENKWGASERLQISGTLAFMWRWV